MTRNNKTEIVDMHEEISKDDKIRLEKLDTATLAELPASMQAKLPTDVQVQLLVKMSVPKCIRLLDEIPKNRATELAMRYFDSMTSLPGYLVANHHDPDSVSGGEVAGEPVLHDDFKGIDGDEEQ